ncbi:hypothetical protein ACIB24_18450 [Spongisporangium articulatum]|uniref:Uncharacterized protein n=1 Tax=Spongisporangium articulatum TaxID=3362603 RepID=A0ABW8ARM6_9ACTN
MTHGGSGRYDGWDLPYRPDLARGHRVARAPIRRKSARGRSIRRLLLLVALVAVVGVVGHEATHLAAWFQDYVAAE